MDLNVHRLIADLEAAKHNLALKEGAYYSAEQDYLHACKLMSDCRKRLDAELQNRFGGTTGTDADTN